MTRSGVSDTRKGYSMDSFLREHARMKVRKLVWPMFLVCGVLTAAFLPACEEKTEEEAPPAEAGKASGGEAAGAGAGTGAGTAGTGTGAAALKKEEPPPPPPKPEDVCTSLVTAVKAKDEAKVLALSTAGSATALTPEAKEHVMAELGAANCGAAKVDGAAATVALTGGAEPQDAPFVKDGADWKFDAAAYLTKYPPAKGAKGKAAKGKEKDHGKAKAKAKGKHKH